MATLKFILRPSRSDYKSEGRLCARLIHDRKVRVQTLELSLRPEEWDEKGQAILPREEGNPRFDYLEESSKKCK